MDGVLDLNQNDEFNERVKDKNLKQHTWSSIENSPWEEHLLQT